MHCERYKAAPGALGAVLQMAEANLKIRKFLAAAKMPVKVQIFYVLDQPICCWQ